MTSDPAERVSLVLTNPPFGKKSSISIVNEDAELENHDSTYERTGFWVTTKNKQLNFLQHVKTMLKINGRCAVVVPEIVLFEGGAGETVRRNLLKQYDVHALLRLPTGIFYAQGVKANVLFFESKSAQEKTWTEELWVYDLRTNMHFPLKNKPAETSRPGRVRQMLQPKESQSPQSHMVGRNTRRPLAMLRIRRPANGP